MAVETRIQGLAELDRLLKQLPTRIEANVLRGALRAGQKAISDRAKQNLVTNGSVDTGALRDSLRVRFARKSAKFGWLRSNLIAGNKDAWYAHLVEFGSGSFYTGSGESVRGPYEIKPKNRKSLLIAGIMRETVTHPGAKPKPFMRPAVDSGVAEATDAFAEYVRKRVPRELERARG
jgi:HK97 gp10 family phage protein